MKRSEFVKKVLKSKRNTVFTNESQILTVLQIFQSLGMKPPTYENPAWRPNENTSMFLNEWEPE